MKTLYVCAALLVATPAVAGAEVPAQYRGLWCELRKLLFAEPATALRLICIGLILSGIVGLKLVT